MRREIAEQGAAVAATLAEVRRRADQVRAAASDRRRILFVARGSSDNAAIYGRYLVETQLGVPAALAAPSVATHYRARLDLSDALVVSVSQSGRTAEIVEVQRWAGSMGAATVAISNEVGLGVVPATRLGRRYRDLLGEVNRSWVGAAEESWFVVAGRRLRLE